MAEIEIKLPDGRIVVVDDSDAEMVQKVKDKIRLDFPDIEKETGQETGQGARKPDKPAERRGAGPIKRFTQDFGRGVQRIASGDVSAEEVGRTAERSIRSLTAPIGGDLVAAGAENIVRGVTGQDINPNALKEQRERRETLADEAPVQAIASEALGFGGVTKMVSRMFPFLNVTRGSTVANPNRVTNAAKVSGEAIATTAVGELAKGSSVGETAVSSGVAGVVAPPLSAAIRAVAQGVSGTQSGARSALTESTGGTTMSVAALRAIAQRTGQSLDDIRNAAQEFTRRNGFGPSLAEIVDEQTIDQYKALAMQRARAANQLDVAEEEAARRRPEQLRNTLSEGEPPLSREALQIARNTEMTNTLRIGSNGNPPVADGIIDPEPFRVLFGEAEGNPEILLALPNRLRRRLARAMGTAGDEAGEAGGEAGEEELEDFTIGLAEDVRLALDKIGGRGEAYQFIQARNDVSDILSEQSEAYAEAFQRYAEQSQFIDGLERGGKLFSAKRADFEDVIPELNSDFERAGVASGVRGAAAESAGETAASAVTTARRIQEPGVQARITAARGPAAAERAAAVGRTQTTSASNLARLSPRSELPPSLAAAAGDLTEIAAAATGRAGSQLIARVVSSMAGRLRSLGVPPNAAVNMARLITDPTRTTEVITRLAEMGLEEAAIARMAAEAGATLSATTGGGAQDLLEGDRIVGTE